MFFAQLVEGYGYIHVPADRMELKDDMIYVYSGEKLAAAVDVSVVLFAHVSEKRRLENV